MSVEIPNTPYWQPKNAAHGEVVTGLDELGQAIENIFSTPIGSVPLMPRFGFDAIRALGKPLYTAKRMLERMAIEAFYWEPRVEVLSVNAAIVSESAVLLCLVWRPLGAVDAVVQVLGVAA